MSDAAVRRLVVTLGDPRGIGPEVAVAAARRLGADANAPTLLFIGPHGVVDADDIELHGVGDWRPGGSAALAGRLAGDAVVAAVDMVRRGRAHGIVTAPIDKAALHAGGFDFPGHTEMLAHLAGDVDVAMLMAAESTALGGPLRVVLATTHLALRDVPRALDQALLVRQTEITYFALQQQWSIREPRIALCAFNPHASDHGRFGDEEERIYTPALAQLTANGIRAHGPIPADTVFVRALRGEFDAVVAPYHDVGMAAFKTASFGRGVNVTLGLPFVRTSPDHGTALDIAGRGIADASSMLAAIRLADRLAAARTNEVAP
jgi:4-hydroxythreonine-4-phosphate dehydrogenase